MSDADEELEREPSEPVTARVQEADCAQAVVVLKVRVPGRTSFIVVGAPPNAQGDAHKGTAAGLLTADVRKRHWGGRLPPGASRERAREDALKGARIVAVTDSGVFLEQGDRFRVLKGRGGRVVLTDVERPRTSDAAPNEDGERSADPIDAVAIERLGDVADETRARLEARGEAIAREIAHASIDLRRADLVRAIEKAEVRITRRIEAVTADLAKIEEAERIAAQATWLIAEAKRTPRGATELVVTDWSTGEAQQRRIPLDPSKSASEQVEAMFKRAKRLRLGGVIANDRRSQAQTQLEGVREARRSMASAQDLPSLEELAREAKRRAPRDVTLPSLDAGSAGPRERAKPSESRRDASTRGARRIPYRTFRARSGAKILVGKGAADNDALTLKTARPHDLWLHAKDRTGAHVVVPLQKGHSCPAEDLVDAAHLAAHFSDVRSEASVDVQYTHRRHLRKPKGSVPGFVVVDREKVLVLRVDPATVRALLEREEV